MHSEESPYQYEKCVFFKIHAIVEKKTRDAMCITEAERRSIWWEDVRFNTIGAFLCIVPPYDDELFCDIYFIFNILADHSKKGHAAANVCRKLELSNTPMDTRVTIWNQAWKNRHMRDFLLKYISDMKQPKNDDSKWSWSWGSQTWDSESWGSQSWGSQSWGSQSWGSQSWGSQSWGSQSWGSGSWERR
jgi:hypothetical protein